MKHILFNKYLFAVLLLAGGIAIGRFLWHPSPAEPHSAAEAGTAEVWTCSMHPQIRTDKPGKCPICGMDLILLGSGHQEGDSHLVHLTPDAMALANVATSPVSPARPQKELILYGKIEADERRVQVQAAHIPGRVEKLLVNFTGEAVKPGQGLALIYSPELIIAQQELLEAAAIRQQQPAIYNAAREKLMRWNMPESWIREVEQTHQVQSSVEIGSNTLGVVLRRLVNQGDYVEQGSALFEIADLSRVWVVFDAYESDMVFLENGDMVRFEVNSFPGKAFKGTVEYIDPVIDPVTRVARVRLSVSNPGGRLKPGMFATGNLTASLPQSGISLIIPETAVLWTGKRSVVYVRESGTMEPHFSMREIELGPLLGDSYVVVSGLYEGEEVVTRGAFSVDAAAQLAGKPSMMNTPAK